MSVSSYRPRDVSRKDLEIVIKRDETYRSTVKTKNYTTKKLEPYDLTNITEMTMIINDKIDKSIIYFTGTLTGTQCVIEDGTNGIYRVDVSKTITSLIPKGTHEYDIFIVTASGYEKLVIYGDMIAIET